MWPSAALCLAQITNMFQGQASAGVTSSQMDDLKAF